MAQLVEVRHTIQSVPFEAFLNRFRRGLKVDDKYAFDIPDLLKDICKVTFVHNKKKAVIYKNHPKGTIFVDDIEDFLTYFNPIVEKETRGYFRKLDECTEHDMRNPEFRSALIAFFYLEGVWDAESFGPRPFHNLDGRIETVNYIGFFGARVVVADGKLKSHVNYVIPDNKRKLDRVVFTMPVDSSYEDGIYEHSLLLIPEVTLNYRRVEGNELDRTVINFKYLHNEDGFKAIGLYASVSCDGDGPKVYQRFILDKPFKIDIYYEAEKIL